MISHIDQFVRIINLLVGKLSDIIVKILIHTRVICDKYFIKVCKINNLSKKFQTNVLFLSSTLRE